jgi:hypothetical protein
MGYIKERRFCQRVAHFAGPIDLTTPFAEGRLALRSPIASTVVGGAAASNLATPPAILRANSGVPGALDKERLTGKIGLVWFCLVSVCRGSDGSRILDQRSAGIGFHAVAAGASRPGFPAVGSGKLAHSEKPGHYVLLGPLSPGRLREWP